MTPKELELVFGAESQGETPEERATTSLRRFVRGQSQLGEDREAATGVRLGVQWALHVFGYETLKRAVLEGAARINQALDEPARTLRERREAMGLSQREVAATSGLTEADIRRAETPGAISEIRRLQSLAQMMGLNDERLGLQRGTGADHELAVRLRTLRNSAGKARLSAKLVLKLAEAAWIISRQDELQLLLGLNPSLREATLVSDDFGYPIWKIGYGLAEQARLEFGLPADEPIPSARAIIDKLSIPLVQAELGARFAGATVVNGEVRGIVVNIEGDNQNPWVRRMTLCHELGHLLCDPPHRLNRLHVDEYENIYSSTDLVEARANAFAIAFLAPRVAVQRIIDEVDGTRGQLAELMNRYGIAATAARHHLSNVHRLLGYGELDTASIPASDLPQPDDEWTARENWTVDFFPIPEVPVGRRGRFAGLIASALKRGIISADTAAVWLRTSPSQAESRVEDILGLTASDLMQS
jgi:Zn-dependent peptidase ImmA (M78 family)